MTLAPCNAEETCLKNHSHTYRTPSLPQVASSPRDQEKQRAYDGYVATAVDGDTDGTSPPSLSGRRSSRDEITGHEGEVGDEGGDSFPEGGKKAWLTVLGSFCAMMSVFGLINSAAVFESWFSTHQLAEYSASDIGWIFSLNLFIVFFVGLQVGPVFDAYGPRYLVAVGSVLIVASVMLLSLCEKYYQILLCYSVLGGLGGSLLNSPAYGCIAHFFDVRRGLATGIAATSGGIGGIIFPMMLRSLLPKLGFPWSARILGFIFLGLAVPTNLWLRSRLPARGKVSSVWPDFTIFRDRRYAAAAAGVFFMEWGLFVPITYIVSYATAHGQDTSDSYTLLALLNAGSVAGRFLPSLVSDRLGRFNIIIATIALSSAMVLGLWLPAGSSSRMLISFTVLFGFASGSNLGLLAVCLGQLCKPRDYGRYFGTAMTVASFGTLSSLPIGGALLGVGDEETGWKATIAFSGASYAVALVCYATARVEAVGWGLRAVF